MKKILLIFTIILMSSQVFSLSLFGAHDISKNYISENEMIDSFTQPRISCDEDNFFIIPVINTLGEPVLFVPISITESKVHLSQTDSFNIKLIKTEFLLRELKNSDPNNFLSKQLLDRISSLINSLDLKKAQLEGLQENNYSFEVKDQLTQTINQINNLLGLLKRLHENLEELLREQNVFLQAPNCNVTNNFLNLFENSFENYEQMIPNFRDYRESTNQLITKIVSDENIPLTQKQGTINLVSIPANTESSINNISESLSLTSSFYINLSSNLKGKVGDDKIKLFIDNLKLRIDQKNLINTMTRYDPEFPNYSNLDAVVNLILNPEYRMYWKEQDKVNNINYLNNEIKEYSQKAQYSKALELVSLLKKDSRAVLDSGFKEYEDEINWFYYIFVSFFIVILVIFLIILKKSKKKEFTPSKYKQKKIKKENNDIFDFRDPF